MASSLAERITPGGAQRPRGDRPSPTARRRGMGASRRSELFWLALLLAPFMAFLVVFKIAPIFINIAFSFMQVDLQGGGEFIGAANYTHLANDELFFTALRNTFQYLLYVGPVNVVLGFVIALLLNVKLRGRTVARGAVFLPYILMVTVVGITWRWILDGTNGLLNHYLEMLGLGPIYFLTDPATAMIGIALTSIWWTVGYNVIIYLAALQDIPAELMDAASIDGAGPWRRLWSITIPLMKNTTFYVVITTVIYSMQVFGQVYVMTSGGPSYSTLSLVQYMYIKGFKEFDLGYAATIGTALFAVIGLLSAVVFVLFRDRASRRPLRRLTRKVAR
ncbi:carbohydrate ABC transporter permease [Microbacterium sp. C23T]